MFMSIGLSRLKSKDILNFVTLVTGIGKMLMRGIDYMSYLKNYYIIWNDSMVDEPITGLL